MRFPDVLLEDWMRDHYFEATIDLGSSGVADYSLRELRELAGIELAELDDVVLRDSPCVGRQDLRRAIAQRSSDGNPEGVITTHGASEAIYVCLQTLLEPGDHVVALHPAYHTHTSVARSLGCPVSYWTLRPERGFVPDVADLAAAVRPDTRAIVLNFPHNPTGVTLTEPQLHDVVRIAAEVGAHLVWDAAFSDLTYGTAPLPDPTSLYPRAVSIGTFSKAFGLPGMRFGWAVAAPDLIRRMIPLRDRITLSLSPLLETLALHVVTRADQVLGRRHQQAAVNRDRLIRWADEHRDEVDLPVPDGGVTGFPALRGHDDTREFCRRLSTEHGVLLVPGLAFDHADRVRLGFGGPAGSFAAGLDILSTELRTISRSIRAPRPVD